MKYNCIDLFCGAGEMSYGFEKAGFDTIFAVEFNNVYAETYKLNFKKAKVHVGDIKDITNEEIISLGKNHVVDIIIGGPPCQGFSIAGNIGRRFLDDERNHLFLEYVRFVKLLQPKMFVLENVASLVKHNKGLHKLTGLSRSTITKLVKGENVNTDVLERICIALECQLDDIVEMKKEEI